MVGGERWLLFFVDNIDGIVGNQCLRIPFNIWGRRGRVVVGVTITCAITTYHH